MSAVIEAGEGWNCMGIFEESHGMQRNQHFSDRQLLLLKPGACVALTAVKVGRAIMVSTLISCTSIQVPKDYFFHIDMDSLLGSSHFKIYDPPTEDRLRIDLIGEKSSIALVWQGIPKLVITHLQEPGAPELLLPWLYQIDDLFQEDRGHEN